MYLGVIALVDGIKNNCGIGIITPSGECNKIVGHFFPSFFLYTIFPIISMNYKKNTNLTQHTDTDLCTSVRKTKTTMTTRTTILHQRRRNPKRNDSSMTWTNTISWLLRHLLPSLPLNQRSPENRVVVRVHFWRRRIFFERAQRNLWWVRYVSRRKRVRSHAHDLEPLMGRWTHLQLRRNSQDLDLIVVVSLHVSLHFISTVIVSSKVPHLLNMRIFSFLRFLDISFKLLSRSLRLLCLRTTVQRLRRRERNKEDFEEDLRCCKIKNPTTQARVR